MSIVLPSLSGYIQNLPSAEIQKYVFPVDKLFENFKYFDDRTQKPNAIPKSTYIAWYPCACQYIFSQQLLLTLKSAISETICNGAQYAGKVAGHIWKRLQTEHASWINEIKTRIGQLQTNAPEDYTRAIAESKQTKKRGRDANVSTEQPTQSAADNLLSNGWTCPTAIERVRSLDSVESAAEQHLNQDVELPSTPKKRKVEEVCQEFQELLQSYKDDNLILKNRLSQTVTREREYRQKYEEMLIKYQQLQKEKQQLEQQCEDAEQEISDLSTSLIEGIRLLETLGDWKKCAMASIIQNQTCSIYGCENKVSRICKQCKQCICSNCHKNVTTVREYDVDYGLDESGLHLGCSGIMKVKCPNCSAQPFVTIPLM